MSVTIQNQHGFPPQKYIPSVEDGLNRKPAVFRLFGRSRVKHLLISLMGLTIGLIIGFALPGQLLAQEESSLPALQQLAGSIEKALAKHRVELLQLKDRVDQMESLEKTVNSLLQASESENIALSDLLLMPQPQIASLKYAKNNNLLALDVLAQQYETLRKQHEAGSIQVKQYAERIELAQNQLADLKNASLPDIQKQTLETATRELIRVLKEKKQLGDRYLRIHDALMSRLQIAMDKKAALDEKIAAQLEKLIKASMFEQINHYRGIGHTLPAALLSLGSRVKIFFSPPMWQTLWSRLKIDGFFQLAIFGFWLALILWVQARLGSFLMKVEENYEAPNRSYRRLGIDLLRRSLPYLGMTVLFGIYSFLNRALLNIGLRQAMFQIFLTLLISRWGLDYLDHGLSGPPTILRSFVSLHLSRLIRMLRAVFLGAIIFVWVSGGGGLLIRLGVDLLAVGLLVWTVIFWRRVTPVVAGGVRKGEPGPNPLHMKLVKVWSYLVSGGMLFLSVAGYNMLAGKWISAWIITVALLFLSGIILRALREWRRELRSEAAAGGDHKPDSAVQLRRSLILLCEVGLVLCLAGGLILAWDYHNLLISRLKQMLAVPIKVGTIGLSLKGVLTAVAILFITHLLVRIGCSLLRELVLDKRPLLERGFKDSILTVSSYLGWGLGLLLALGAVGVNTTSLAVVFGALSVGIGFGLQTIFNNFISGLILLFERPIQVGDTIEINGIWAEVKKINVRATVVQTFDNASLIIPNSELISKQVTNWTFKDPRMRRSIEVGAAYGSDINLIEKTMLEIARGDIDVLKYPRPDVLFIDHADSALIFRLRVWVHFDNYWTVPHRIRRDIDRRFRELNIEIAFPQRDLHLRSVPKGMRETDTAIGEVPVDEPSTQA